MSDPRTDEGLMLAYRDGDGDAFAELYARWRGRLYRYMLRLAGEHTDELFQDVWLSVVKARTGYQPTARFSTWLFRIAHNRIVDHYRSAGRAPVQWDDEGTDPFESMPGPEHETPHAMLDRKETALALLDALAELPPPQREAFLMAEESGMTLEQIAQATGVGRETVKSRLRYAVSRLRARLGERR